MLVSLGAELYKPNSRNLKPWPSAVRVRLESLNRSGDQIITKIPVLRSGRYLPTFEYPLYLRLTLNTAFRPGHCIESFPRDSLFTFLANPIAILPASAQ